MANKTTYELALEIGGKIQSSLEKSVGGVNKKLDSIGKAAKTAAKIATAAFAAVKIGDFVKDAVSVYADFDQAMANTAATAGATSEEYAKLEAAALEMGKNGPCRLGREHFYFGPGTGSSIVGSYWNGSGDVF